MARARQLFAELEPAPPTDPLLWEAEGLRATEAWRKVTEILLRAEARLAEQQAQSACLHLIVAGDANNHTPTMGDQPGGHNNDRSDDRDDQKRTRGRAA